MSAGAHGNRLSRLRPGGQQQCQGHEGRLHNPGPAGHEAHLGGHKGDEPYGAGRCCGQLPLLGHEGRQLPQLLLAADGAAVGAAIGPLGGVVRTQPRF